MVCCEIKILWTTHDVNPRVGAPVENFPRQPVSEEAEAELNAAAKDSSQNDNFRYRQAAQQSRCPYAAHTRKTNPRDDFPFEFSVHQDRRIIRRGIQYGPEVTDEETATSTSSPDPKLERGLLFVCYQSDLSKGFSFIQKSESFHHNPSNYAHSIRMGKHPELSR